MTLHTQIVWDIRLQPARKGKHKLLIKIFNYDSSDKPASQIISLPDTLDEIANFRSTANQKDLIWTEHLTIEVSQIAQAYESPIPNPIIAYCTFDYEEEQYLQYGDFYVIDVAFNCVALKASSIEVNLILLEVPILWFSIDWSILKIIELLHFLNFFKNRQMAGVYNVKEAEGFQKPVVLKEGRDPILKFEKSGQIDNFPRINFHFFRPVKPMLLILLGFLLFWGLHKILSLLINLLF